MSRRGRAAAHQIPNVGAIVVYRREDEPTRTGVIMEHLSTRQSVNGRAHVYFPLDGETRTLYVTDLIAIDSSADAKALGGLGGTYVEGYEECVPWLYHNEYFEAHLHLDVVGALLAPALGPRADVPFAGLKCLSIGAGIGVHFSVLQSCIIPSLREAVGADVQLHFTAYELGDCVRVTRRILNANKSSSTTVEVRDDVRTFVLDEMGVWHEIHVSLDCKDLSHSGGAGLANALVNLREEFAVPKLGLVKVDLNQIGVIATGFAMALMHSALIVGAALKVNRHLSWSLETTANARPCALDTVVEMFRRAVGPAHAVFAHEQKCADSSAMMGDRYFLTSAEVAPAVATDDTPTIPSLMQPYLDELFLHDGVRRVVSSRQPPKLRRIMRGKLRSSCSQANGADATGAAAPDGIARYGATACTSTTSAPTARSSRRSPSRSASTCSRGSTGCSPTGSTRARATTTRGRCCSSSSRAPCPRAPSGPSCCPTLTSTPLSSATARRAARRSRGTSARASSSGSSTGWTAGARWWCTRSRRRTRSARSPRAPASTPSARSTSRASTSRGACSCARRSARRSRWTRPPSRSTCARRCARRRARTTPTASPSRSDCWRSRPSTRGETVSDGDV